MFFVCFSDIEKTVNESVPSVGAFPSSSADIAIEGDIILQLQTRYNVYYKYITHDKIYSNTIWFLQVKGY